MVGCLWLVPVVRWPEDREKLSIVATALHSDVVVEVAQYCNRTVTELYSLRAKGNRTSCTPLRSGCSHLRTSLLSST